MGGVGGGALEDAGGRQQVAVLLQWGSGRDSASGRLITAHYGGKSDNNPHGAASCSPDRSNDFDRDIIEGAKTNPIVSLEL